MIGWEPGVGAYAGRGLSGGVFDNRPVPQPDDDTIEAARQRVRKYLAELDGLYGDEDPGDVLDYADGGSASAALLLSDVRLLASPVREPGRSEAEHDCETCADCIHNGHRCCGCYDGACCRAARVADQVTDTEGMD